MKEFISTFQLSKTIIFNVEYYTLSTNSCPRFVTSADQFARNKKDFVRCGQAQNELLENYPVAMKFFRKWDKHHLQQLDETQYSEMLSDLQKLKEKYNYLYCELDETKKPYDPNFGFYFLAEWTKQTPKQNKRNGGPQK